jgi:NtrC-family two-component system response regulator AlgB
VASSEVRLGGRLTLEEVKAEHVRRVVANTRTLEEAATVLGIDPTTLYRQRKRL